MRRQFLLAGFLLTAASQLFAAGSPRQSLNRTIEAVDFTGQSLTDVVDFLRESSGANLHVNWKALEEAGVSKDTPVTLRLRSVQLRKVLTLALNEAAGGNALTFYVDDNIIEVTTRALADGVLITRVYPVQDLIVDIPDFKAPEFNITSSSGGGGGSGGSGGGSSQGLFGGGGGGGSNNGGTKTADRQTPQQRADAIVTLIKTIIQPDIWTDNGGTASIAYFNGNLIVTAPRSIHEQLGGYID